MRSPPLLRTTPLGVADAKAEQGAKVYNFGELLYDKN